MIPGRHVALRPIEPSDLGLLQRIANDVRIGATVVGWDFPVAEYGQQAWLDASQTNTRVRRLMVQRLDTGAPVGVTGLWDIDWHNRSAMTATKLDPEQLGRGMGSDAIMVTMAWAFFIVGLRRLHGAILDFNGASFGAYVDRCGWTVEGRHREAIFRKGRWCDLYSVAVLRSDFEQHPLRDEYVQRIVPIDIDEKVTRSVEP